MRKIFKTLIAIALAICGLMGCHQKIPNQDLKQSADTTESKDRSLYYFDKVLNDIPINVCFAPPKDKPVEGTEQDNRFNIPRYTDPTNIPYYGLQPLKAEIEASIQAYAYYIKKAAGKPLDLDTTLPATINFVESIARQYVTIKIENGKKDDGTPKMKTIMSNVSLYYKISEEAGKLAYDDYIAFRPSDDKPDSLKEAKSYFESINNTSGQKKGWATSSNIVDCDFYVKTYGDTGTTPVWGPMKFDVTGEKVFVSNEDFLSQHDIDLLISDIENITIEKYLKDKNAYPYLNGSRGMTWDLVIPVLTSKYTKGLVTLQEYADYYGITANTAGDSLSAVPQLVKSGKDLTDVKSLVKMIVSRGYSQIPVINTEARIVRDNPAIETCEAYNAENYVPENESNVSNDENITQPIELPYWFIMSAFLENIGEAFNAQDTTSLFSLRDVSIFDKEKGNVFISGGRWGRLYLTDTEIYNVIDEGIKENFPLEYISLENISNPLENLIRHKICQSVGKVL